MRIHKIIAATSAWALLTAGASYAQGFEPFFDTGIDAADGFEPSDVNDSPTPNIVQDDELGDTGITASAMDQRLDMGTTAAVEAPDVDTGLTTGAVEPTPLVPFLDTGIDAADGFKPSDANDSPTPDIAQDEGLGDEGITTGAITGPTIVRPPLPADPDVSVAQAVQPSDQGDDPVPDVADPAPRYY
ncbi:hypothetical protein [Chelativorans salis]|uniref:Uncharacterized protein n=1 Tax=Chelativorans salis TaxID=2978478 RepID=A0ABT2LIF7_9HYPH|nr:hypothetical protein [Chelativorans sp. EGI FJ00035]MCT7374336.1 hypothetical protein [Chelativorans sp. EGI FJ00035]